MKANEPIKEANFRSYRPTREQTQSHDKVHAMKVPQNPNQNEHLPGEAPLNESHTNLMQSWQNLRGLDSKLAQTKYKDMATTPKPPKGRRRA